MNSMHLYSIIFILSLFYTFSGSLSLKNNVRVRRAEPVFVETKCTLIDSASKERCSTATSEDAAGRVTHSQSCVFDEKFRVSYQTKDGKNVISAIETYGHTFPRLMKAGDLDKCYYHPTNARIVRWTFKSEEWSTVGIIVSIVIFVIFAGCCIVTAIFASSRF